MSKNNSTVGSTKYISKLERPLFGPGMLLQHDDLELLNVYPRELSRILFKSLFGCGVICGLEVSAKPKCDKLEVTVEAGVALACSGDPIHVPKTQTVYTKEDFDLESLKDGLWVVLCGIVKSCTPRTAICGDDDETPSMPTRERVGLEIRLMTERCGCSCYPRDASTPLIQESKCKCDVPYQPVRPVEGQPGQIPERGLNCYDNHYDGKCGCLCDDCSDDDCQCILLAHLVKTDNKDRPWLADHRVRRFIRPVLIRDPVVERQERARKAEQDEKDKAQVQDAIQPVAAAPVEFEVAMLEPAQAEAPLAEINEPPVEPAPEPAAAAPARQPRQQNVQAVAQNKPGRRTGR